MRRLSDSSRFLRRQKTRRKIAARTARGTRMEGRMTARLRLRLAPAAAAAPNEVELGNGVVPEGVPSVAELVGGEVGDVESVGKGTEDEGSAEVDGRAEVEGPDDGSADVACDVDVGGGDDDGGVDGEDEGGGSDVVGAVVEGERDGDAEVSGGTGVVVCADSVGAGDGWLAVASAVVSASVSEVAVGDTDPPNDHPSPRGMLGP